jgi:hypothetical protein
MSDIESRIRIKKESRKRINKIKFGDEVTNICAGENNPMKHCYFVRKIRKGVVQCTDKNGAFWDIGVDVIYQGHLSVDKCKELFDPVWEEEYGNK